MKLCIANVRGLSDPRQRSVTLSNLKKFDADVNILTETKLSRNDELSVRLAWGQHTDNVSAHMDPNNGHL